MLNKIKPKKGNIERAPRSGFGLFDIFERLIRSVQRTKGARADFHGHHRLGHGIPEIDQHFFQVLVTASGNTEFSN